MRSQARKVDEAKRKRIQEISARHETEFIDNQYEDFEEILGMTKGERDPNKKQALVLDAHVVDAMKEFMFFSKQVDGYPWYFERDPFKTYSLFG